MLESLLELLVRGALVYDGDVDAHLGESGSEQVVCAAVDICGGDHMLSGLADVEAGKEVCCLAGGGEHSGNTAFHCREPCCYVVVCGVLQAGVEVSCFFQVEQAAHLVACGVFECRALDNWNLAGTAVLRLIPCVDSQGSYLVLVHLTNL